MSNVRQKTTYLVPRGPILILLLLAAAGPGMAVAQLDTTRSVADRLVQETLARFEARSPDPAEVTSHAPACLAENGRVMQRITTAIGVGPSAGSIRSALDPIRPEVTLWAYTHGLIRVAASKGQMLRQYHAVSDHAVSGNDLVARGLEMAGVALTGSWD